QSQMIKNILDLTTLGLEHPSVVISQRRLRKLLDDFVVGDASFFQRLSCTSEVVGVELGLHNFRHGPCCRELHLDEVNEQADVLLPQFSMCLHRVAHARITTKY